MRRHSRLSWVLLAVGTTLLALGTLAAFVNETFASSEVFADRAEAAFSTPEVRSAIAQTTVDQIVAADPDLLAVRPVLVAVVEGALSTDVARTLFRGATADLHRTLFTDDDDTAIIRITDLIIVAKSQVSALDPELGAKIPDDLTDSVIELRTNAQSLDAFQFVEGLELLSLVLPILALIAFVAAAWADPLGSTIVVRIGLAIVMSALLVMLSTELLRVAIIDGDDPLAVAVWDSFVDPLDTWVLALAAIGAVLAAVAWFGVDDLSIRPRLERAAHITRRRTSRGHRLVWGLCAALGGAVVALEPMRIVQFAVVIVGVVIFAAGAREVAVSIAPGLLAGANDRPDGEAEARVGIRVAVTVALFLVGLVAVVGVWASDRSAAADDSDVVGCNGTPVLCDRRFDEVVMAATHNSNAAAEEDFVNGYQTVGMEEQLRDGIRSFLIDVYWGFPSGQLVITDRSPMSPEEREILVADVGESAVRAAEATAAGFESTGVERELFLCHALCEIGASRFVDELQKIKGFLDDHPAEVISFIIQDEGPQPDDIAAAFEAADMLDMLHAQELDEPWPTLREMIDSGERVFVSAENVAGGYDWYHDAFSFVQDTPFKFESVESFSCELFRGEDDSPLFLVNHWLSPVSPTAADTANSAEVLVDRLDECGDVRDRRPNMIAVDFHDRGDLLRVVDQLNLS